MCRASLRPAWRCSPALGQSACLYNSYRDKGLYPASDSYRFHAQGQLQLTGDMTAFVELGWRQSDYRRKYVDWPVAIAATDTTPGSVPFNFASAQGFSSGAYVLFSGSALGPLDIWFGERSRRFVTGLNGRWQDWNFKAGYYYSDNRATNDVGIFGSYPKLGEALFSQIVSGSLEEQKLQSMVTSRASQAQGFSSLQGLDFKASRSIGEWDGRDVMLAWGTDLRLERARFERLGLVGQPDYAGQRNVWAQFAELQLPFSDQVEGLGSLRHDRYSDFGDTMHAKLAAKWVPSSNWLLRGAWGTGFRAPAIAQMQETGRYLGGTVSNPCTSALQALATHLGGVCPPNNQFNLYTQGSSKLQPELSRQWNLGLSLMLDRNHIWSADYWHVDLRNKISYLNQNLVLSNPEKYRDHAVLTPDGTLGLYLPMTNVGQSQMSGLDLGWQFRRPLDSGLLTMGLTVTRVLMSRYQGADGEPFVDDLNRYSYSSGSVVPKWRMRGQLGFQRADWQSQLLLNYLGAYEGGPVSLVAADTGQSIILPSLRVPAWWTLDWTATYQWNRQTTLRVGVENVFNRNAPLDLSQSTSFNFGTSPVLGSVWGRTISLVFSYRF